MFKSPTAAKLQEIGPRFTLKLRWLRKGLPAVGAADGVAPGQAAEEVGEEEESGVEDAADEGELNDLQMDEGMEVEKRAPVRDESGDEGEGDGEEENMATAKKGLGKGKDGKRIPALDEQQEYEWKWKVGRGAGRGGTGRALTSDFRRDSAQDGGVAADVLPVDWTAFKALHPAPLRMPTLLRVDPRHCSRPRSLPTP